MTRNLAQRLAVAAVFIPAIIWVIYQGGWWLYGMLLLFAAIGMGEFLSGEGWKATGPVFWLSLITIGTIFTLVAAPLANSDGTTSPTTGVIEGVSLLAGYFLVSGMLFAVGKRMPAELFASHARLFWGMAYISIGYTTVFLVGSGMHGYHGGDALLLLFAVLWVGDTAAMGVGKAIGRHKLAPGVSPNKTVEGFVGGIMGSVVIGLVMYFWKFQALGIGHTLAIAAGASVFGQLGDLAESMWKRSVGVKDSSAIIPGHGGVLDRFDSLLFAAPFALAYFMLIRP